EKIVITCCHGVLVSVYVLLFVFYFFFFFFSSRRRHTRSDRDWSSDVCSSDLLHFAAGAGCLEVVALLLRLGADPNVQGRGDHTPLYCVANECASETGPEVVRALVRAGADVNACGGVTRATALHMAARRGYVDIARALLDSGAAVN